MNELLYASVMTLIVILIDIFFKQKSRYHVYLIFFLIVLALCLFLRPAKSQANEWIPDANIEKLKLKDFELLNRGELEYYKNKAANHLMNGDKCYKIAKDKCWWLPANDDRQNAKNCFGAAGAALVAGDPRSKVVAALITLMVSYGLDCINEWHDIQGYLHWAGYHYEMHEFYVGVVNKG